MEFVTTLVHNRNLGVRILKEVNKNTIVLFPESLMLHGQTVKYYSKKKNLFIIYNEDLYIDHKNYTTMRGVDNGKLKWTVSKYYLWKEDYDYDTPLNQFDNF